MGKQTFKYILLCMAIYMALAAIEIFAIMPLINLIDTRFSVRTIVILVLLIVIDPIVTYIIVNNAFKFQSEDIVSKENIIKGDK